MSALRSMLAWDVRLRVRFGFYAVYAVLTAVSVLGLRAAPSGLRTDAAVLLVVTDPTVLGFYFVAAMVLFERGEGVLDALVTSPLGDRGYLASKVLSLSLLAVAASTMVAVLGHGATNLPVLIVGVALGASLFVLVGFVSVARFDSVNEYFLGAVGWGSVLFLPLFGYVGLLQSPLLHLLPVQPVLVLVGTATVAAFGGPAIRSESARSPRTPSRASRSANAPTWSSSGRPSSSQSSRNRSSSSPARPATRHGRSTWPSASSRTGSRWRASRGGSPAGRTDRRSRRGVALNFPLRVAPPWSRSPTTARTAAR
ncbi:hypothetical protein BRC81_08405 [Halobacteriales archaeon QS_1_68_20]|nr:MAG: hypothetical protein BRC81_08405 [Halobacteriales archaeon QS_1_68_20]